MAAAAAVDDAACSRPYVAIARKPAACLSVRGRSRLPDSEKVTAAASHNGCRQSRAQMNRSAPDQLEARLCGAVRPFPNEPGPGLGRSEARAAADSG